MSYLATNQAIRSVAAELAARNFGPIAEFSDHGECENDECGFEGLMEFYAEDSETAVAECPECGDRVEMYTGPDVD